MRELHHRPRLIRDRSWLRSASLFSVQIPAEFRLVASASTGNTATLDFGSAGAGLHTLRLAGDIPALLRFKDSYDVGYPGDIEVSFPASGTTPLTTSSVPLEVDSYLSNPQSGSPGGCGDFTGTSAGVDDTTLLGDSPSAIGSVNNVGPPPYDSNTNDANPQNIKVRTGPLRLAVAGGADGWGTANLFGLAPSGQQPVRLHINLSAPVSTLIRVAPSDATYAALDPNFQCRQFWTGTENDALSADLAGRMQISPALTADGRIRLATLQLSSPDPRPVTFGVCLDPYQTLAAGSSGGPGPSSTSPYVDAGTASPPPTVACGASGGPLSVAPFSFAPTGRSETLAGQFAVTNLTLQLLLGNSP